MSFVIALDQSTSATKALLLDDTGRMLDRESREHKQHYPQPGWVEHDAEEIWQNTCRVLKTLLARQADRVAELRCLSITNQRETIVVFEKGSGRPVFPAIVWQCRRGDPLCAEQVEKGRDETIRARTGLRLDAYFSGSKLQWMVRQHPGLQKRMKLGEVLIGTIDTYLIYRLTEGRVFATDHTNASRTLLFDIGRLRWDSELCDWWEVPIEALPEVRESSAHFGETTCAGAVEKPLPICGVMGDSQASLFAQRCFEPGMGKVTFGTGSSVLLNIGSDLRLSERGVVSALAWVHQGVPTYAFEGIIISSASTLTWLRDQLGIIGGFEESEKMSVELDDNDGVYLVPAFTGLGFPHWEPDARAAIIGLSSHSDRRHVVRAALESMAYQLRDALDAMREEADLPLRGLQADGGPTANTFLMQFTADLTGSELRIATMPDCSALGAALAGMLGMGVYASLEAIAAAPRNDVVYRRLMEVDRAERLYAGWRKAVKQVLGCDREHNPEAVNSIL